MPRKFWKRGKLTRWQWFWSRLSVIVIWTWLIGILVGLVLVIRSCTRNPADVVAVHVLIYIVLWCIGGFLAYWTCEVLSGSTVMGSVDPWED